MKDCNCGCMRGLVPAWYCSTKDNDPWWMIDIDNMLDAIEKGEFPMPQYAVTVQLPRDHDPIQTLTIHALNEEDARYRAKRILTELGWLLGTDKNIIDVRLKDS